MFANLLLRNININELLIGIKYYKLFKSWAVGEAST